MAAMAMPTAAATPSMTIIDFWAWVVAMPELVLAEFALALLTVLAGTIVAVAPSSPPSFFFGGGG